MRRVPWLGVLLCLSLAACEGGSGGGASVERSVNDLETLVSTVGYTEAYSDEYQPPSIGDIAAFQQSLEYLFTGDRAAASRRAADIGYELTQVRDALGAEYACLRERPSRVLGRGLYCLRMQGGEDVHVSAPHPHYDIDTDIQSAAVVRGVGARYYSLSTAHRCSSIARSPCDGSTLACGAPGYRISDAAHNTQSFFQEFTVWVAGRAPSAWHVQLHGCSAAFCPSGTEADVVAHLSAGSREILPDSAPVNRLNAALRRRVQAVRPSATTHSCSSQADADDRTLCSTANTQGRYLNGSTDACTAPAASAADSRFLHIEQNLDLRRVDSAADPITPQLLIDAINEALLGRR